MSSQDRVVVLIDMDCFYCQVEEKLNPNLAGKPIAVVQYNAWRGGGIIAVNYSARDQGVTRHMRGKDAKAKCPEINLVQVPELRGKADLTKYRDAGKRVANVLQTFTALLQRASVDEAYLDITESVNKKIAEGLDDLQYEHMKNTFVVGHETGDFLDTVKVNREFSEANLKLAVGGLITEKIRQEVYEKTGYKCSAGIAHNKILAKLVCGLHKPNKQTILPHESIGELFETTRVTKITGLGGKLGESLTTNLGITYMSQLEKFSTKELLQIYDEKTAIWLYNLARGVDLEPVTSKLIAKSIACCKQFPGRTALRTKEKVEQWLSKLSEEMQERLEKDLEENNRKARQIVVNFLQEIDGNDVNSSKSHSLVSYDKKKIEQVAYDILKKMCMKSDGSFHIKLLGLSAGHFEDNKNVREITSFFKSGPTCSKNRNSNDQAHITDISINDETTSDSTKNDSIYMALTQPLDENPDDLVFYDEKYLIVDEKRPEKSKLSFFEKYFQQEKSKPKLDTSVCSTSEEETASEETCPECGESVAISERISHQDYHFALKLAQEEKSIKTSSITPKQASSVSRKTKRKHNGSGSSSSTFLAFFKKDEPDPDATETCPECNKKLKLEEVEGHMDYHVAKKLHLELNSTSTVSVPSKDKPKSKGKAPMKNSALSFFKQTL